MPPRRLILASSSPRRHQLMTEAGYQFESLAPHESVECGICSTGGPASLVVELAMSKAVNVLAFTTSRNVRSLVYFDAASGLPLREEIPAGQAVKILLFL